VAANFPVQRHALDRPCQCAYIQVKTNFLAAAIHSMSKLSVKKIHAELDRPDVVFELAAELFGIMSAPMRLKIISCLCDGERNVSYLLSKIGTTQPNMSQHLNTLYQAGVLGRRREGVQIYYRIIDDRIPALCRAVCSKIETDGNFRAV
jgi:ArsR family transcriptional regulator